MASEDASIDLLLNDQKNNSSFPSNELYKPLDTAPFQFRLATIKPSSSSSEIVHCTLATFSLHRDTNNSQSTPPYEALSYVWGDPHTTTPITLNGYPFPVTQNLASALRHLRPPSGDGPRSVWIDALCINQSDLSERASQVSQMRSIYALATTTIVWLGPATGPSTAAFRFMYAVPVPAGVESVFVVPDGATPGRERAVAEVPRAYLELVEELLRESGEASEGWEALDVEVTRRAWWRRVWVIQELAVSRDVLLKCGTDEIPWRRFSHIIQILNTIKPKTYFPTEGDMDIVVGLDDMRRLSESRFPVLPISHLVVWNYGALATDPRDKIFSLTGLATDTENSSIGADYTLSMREVCENLLLHSIEREKSLDLMCWNSGRTRSESWPSWLPAFDPSMPEDPNNKTKPLLYIFREINFFKALLEDQSLPADHSSSRLKDRYTAASTTSPKATHHSHTRELIISGIPIDTICDTTPPNQSDAYQFLAWEGLVLTHFGDLPAPPAGPFRGLRITSLATGCMNNSDADKTPDFAPHVESQTLRRTLQLLWRRARYAPVMRRDNYGYGYGNGSGNGVNGSSVFEAYAHTLTLGSDPVHQHMISALGGITTTYPGNVQQQPREASTFAWRVSVVPDFVGRRFMVSKEQKLFGLVPGMARKGDLICVLFGCSVPVVLREVVGWEDGDGNGGGRRYVFIGECYVQGMMNGEAITLLNEGVLQESEFILR